MAKKEEVDKEAFLNGMSASFMVWLSSLEGFTFSVSNDMLECFPYEMYDLIVSRSKHETTYTLIPKNSTQH